MQVRIIGSVCMTAVLTYGCVLDRGPVDLWGGLRSRTSPSEAKVDLAGRIQEWRVVEHTVRPGTNKRPSFDGLIVSAGRVTDLGVTGELRLLFFNGKLVTTWFYPEDATPYKARLVQSRSLVFRRSGVVEEAARPGVRVWIGKDG